MRCACGQTSARTCRPSGGPSSDWCHAPYGSCERSNSKRTNCCSRWMRRAISPHKATHNSWHSGSVETGGLRRATVPCRSRPLFRMMSIIADDLSDLPPPPCCHFGLRCTRSWSLKAAQSSARMSLSSSVNSFPYSASAGYTALTSSSRRSTEKRMVPISLCTAIAPELRGRSSFIRRWQRSTASLAIASNFFGMMLQSRANAPMFLVPRGAPALIHSQKRSRSIKGSQWRPLSHQSRAVNERSNFLVYSFWSLTTRRLGVLKGSAAVSPATIAMASHAQPIIKPK
mmetsp:Transcript_57292/g.160728  ORF Transcript_57292/g.160728 Transcript_57292/m.160728 type:complete len:286 (+) Transcript_57292:404-1261(+)